MLVVACRDAHVDFERPVRLDSGEEIEAWVYLYRKDVSQLSLVADGRWVTHAP